MTEEFCFPFELNEITDVIYDSSNINISLVNLEKRANDQKEDFVLSVEEFKYMLNYIRKSIEALKIPDKNFYVFLKTYCHISTVQIQTIKEFGQLWKTKATKQQKMIQQYNSVKYSIFILIYLLKEIVNQQKNKKKRYQKLKANPRGQNNPEVMKEQKRAVQKLRIFNYLLNIIKNLEHIYKFFNPDEQMLKHLQFLGFVLMKDLENFSKQSKEAFEKLDRDLTFFFINVLRMFQTNDKFHRNFKIFLESQEISQIENEYAGKLLSDLLTLNELNINEVVKKTFEAIIIQIINEKSMDNFDNNCRQCLLKFFDLQPQYYFDNFTIFKAMLGSEKHIIRSCFVESLNILLGLLHKKIEEGQQNLENSYREIFNLLIQRSLDKTYNCRLNMLKTVQTILGNFNLSFMDQYQIVCVLGQRIQDQNHYVRSKAIKIVSKTIFAQQSFLNSQRQKQIEQELQQIQNDEKDSQQQEEDDGETSQQNIRKMYLLSQRNIFQKIIEMIPWIKQLIFSTYKSDVNNSLELIVVGRLCQIDQFQELFLLSFKLIWDKEQDIKQKIVDSFYQIVFHKKNNMSIAKELAIIVQDLDMQQRLSFEQVLSELLQKKDNYGIQSDLPRMLWNNFIQDFDKIDEFEENSYNNLYLLRLVQNYFEDWIVSNLENIFAIFKIYYKDNRVDWDIVHEFVLMFIQSHQNLSQEKKDTILKLLVFFMLKHQGCNDSKYFQVTEKIIKLIFILRNDPEKVSDFILKRMANFLNKDVNHISSDQIFDNVDNENDFQMTQFINKRDSKQKPSVAKEDIKFNQKLMHIIFVSGEISLKFLDFFKKVHEQLEKRKNLLENKEHQDELQQSLGRTADQDYQNQKQVLEDIIERLLDPDSMLYSFYAFVQKIVVTEVQKQNPQDDIFFNVCINTLIKFMILNKKISKKNLQLLYDIIDHDKIPESFKSNVIIGIGDLFKRYDNLIEKEIKKLFGSLYSKSEQLKMTTITVLSHLILNDFMKIKADISNFAILILDENPQIVENVQTLFNELQRKEPDFVNNIIVDVLNNLSREEQDGGISIEKFEKFAEYILKFVEKDTNICAMLEKLLDELRLTNELRKMINIGSCIRIIVNKESHVNILNSKAFILRQKLEIDEMKIVVEQILKRLKKNTKIQKGQLESLEKSLFSQSEEAYHRPEGVKKNKTKVKKQQMDKQQFYYTLYSLISSKFNRSY